MPKNSKGIEVAEIIADKCIACQICVAECPVGAIDLSPDGTARIDPEVCVGCGKCAEVCPVEAVSFEKPKRPKAAKKKRRKEPEPAPEHQGVAVYIERDAHGGADVSWELIGKARELAEKRQTKVLGYALGAQVRQVAEEAGAFGCDEVHIIEQERLEHPVSALYADGLVQMVAQTKPEILLMGATAHGRDLAGTVATLLATGLTADCTGLDIEEDTGLLLMTRPTFGGNIMATIFCEHSRPQMSTVRPKVMPMPTRDAGRQWRLEEHAWSPPEGDFPELLEFISTADAEGVDIAQFPVLVVAGRGACDPESFPLLEQLAELLGGVVACSRPVVESGFMPYERQVGQTGKTVAPKLYIGVGVSGAIQHRVAIQGAEKIMAINTDGSAPIFQIADVGIVGDYTAVLPALISQLQEKVKHYG
jgi:electron transfer flavoprotein alpha subunit